MYGAIVVKDADCVRSRLQTGSIGPVFYTEHHK